MNFLTALEIQKFRDQEDTPLHQAAYNGDTAALQQLLKDPELLAKINHRNRLGCSPLRLAATGGHEEALRCLLACGADVNLSDIKTQTPLYVAVKKHQLGCVRILLQAGAKPDGDPRSLCTPIYLAAMDGMFDMMKELVAYGADLDHSQISLGTFVSTPLYITIAYPHLACFRFLLRAGADPDAHTRPSEGGQRHLGACQSLYHAAIRHNVALAFPAELYAFGASLYVRDDKNRLPSEIPQENACADYIRRLYESPCPLLMQCRIQIRKILGFRRIKDIRSLPLPNEIHLYLQHKYT